MKHRRAQRSSWGGRDVDPRGRGVDARGALGSGFSGIPGALKDEISSSSFNVLASQSAC